MATSHPNSQRESAGGSSSRVLAAAGVGAGCPRRMLQLRMLDCSVCKRWLPCSMSRVHGAAVTLLHPLHDECLHLWAARAGALAVCLKLHAR